jgi:hypothetical protein
MLRIESLETEGNNVIRYICSIRVINHYRETSKRHTNLCRNSITVILRRYMDFNFFVTSVPGGGVMPL